MPDRFTRTISTAEFTETPRLSLEQATGDLLIEGWDRPEIKIETSDEDEGFEVVAIHGSIPSTTSCLTRLHVFADTRASQSRAL